MIVKRGITRTVLLTNKWAIKFPSLRTHKMGLSGMLWSICRGILANQSENDWTGQPGFCPVVKSYWGIINIYPRCEEVKELADEEYAKIAQPGPMDNKPENIGLLNGKLVWLDYDMNWNDQPPCKHVKE